MHKPIKPYKENQNFAEDIEGVKNSDIFILISEEEISRGAAIMLNTHSGKPRIFVAGAANSMFWKKYNRLRSYPYCSLSELSHWDSLVIAQMKSCKELLKAYSQKTSSFSDFSSLLKISRKSFSERYFWKEMKLMQNFAAVFISW